MRRELVNQFLKINISLSLMLIIFALQFWKQWLAVTYLIPTHPTPTPRVVSYTGSFQIQLLEIECSKQNKH